ncbi:MAG: pyridoxal phosphate-dependent aminotransferase [Oscillospiraceae bacterium]|nr:pyridoxal phosphate-dependent aminotransferase [Oscillospiraceae bacterium]
MLAEKMVALGTERSVIRELFDYGKRRAAVVGAENVYDFSIGNPSVPAPPSVNETIRRLIDEIDPVILHGYTSAAGDAEAKTALAASINRRFGTNLSPDGLYLTMGAAMSLSCCFHGLCCPEDEFIVPAPYFPEYKVFIESAHGKMVVIPPDTEHFQLDLAAMERAINAHTKAVVINSPNNPSGAVYSEKTIQALADLLETKSAEFGHPIYIISDEPYREIVYDGVRVPYIPKYYNNTLVCYSFSKCLSIPGERIGYVAVHETVEDWQQVFAAIAGAGRALGCVNAPSLFQLVVAACADDTADLSVYAENRRLLVDGLRALGYSCVEPGGTFYLFPQSLEPDDAAFSLRARDDFDLLIVPGSGFGCPGHVRISYCVPTERIQRALPVFAQLAESYKK